MTKYNIEGNINFYEELFKSLDDIDDDDDTNLCQITGLPLVDKAVTLECNHHFNYDALYKEICRQKFDFKTYDIHNLSKKEQLKFLETNLDYYIKCPYCRNMQFTILPYYEELGLKQKYGINSLDNTLPDTILLKNNVYSTPNYGSIDYTFNYYGVTFKNGQCCKSLCSTKYVANITGTDLLYCKHHYNSGLKQFKLSIKNKAIEEKNKLKAEVVKQKEEIIKQKQEILSQRKKLFEEKNMERQSKGLPPLKRMPKPIIENIVQEAPIIGQYVPDPDTNANSNTDVTTNSNIVLCKTILKTGPNKGTQCGCKPVNETEQCKRHSLHLLLFKTPKLVKDK